MIEKMKSLPKQLDTIQENQMKFAEEHQTMLTTAKDIHQMNQNTIEMNQNTIDAGQQMKTALDFLALAYKDLVEKNPLTSVTDNNNYQIATHQHSLKRTSASPTKTTQPCHIWIGRK